MGPLDIKGIDLDLWQRNTFVVVPFLVSSRGYGVFWDNPSYTASAISAAPRRSPPVGCTAWTASRAG